MRFFLIFSILITAFIVKAEINVGVLNSKKAIGSEGIILTLQKDKQIKLKNIKNISPESLKNIQVLIVSHAYDFNKKNVLRQAVKNGMGIFMTHDASGSGRTVYTRAATGTFPEISKPRKGVSTIASRNMRIINSRHPITAGIPVKYLSQYSDHTILFPASNSIVLAEDAERWHEFKKNTFNGTQTRWDKYKGGNAVLVAGKFGKGRVVLYGGLPGLNIKDKAAKMNGNELKLLKNSILWLSGKGVYGTPSSSTLRSKYLAPIKSGSPNYDKNAITIVSNKSVKSFAEGNNEGNKYIELTLPKNIELNKSMIMTFICDQKLGKPAALIIDRVEYPILLTNKNQQLTASFIAIPRSYNIKAILKYKSNFKPVTVKIKKEGRLAEIITPQVRITVASEKGIPSLEFLQIHDWGWHHTWKGLVRNSLSAPLLRLAPSMWPFWKKPFSMYHEQGHPRSDFHIGIQTISNTPLGIKLKVGKGYITVYRSGQILLEEFCNVGRIATWGFDYYLNKSKKFPEVVAHDMPKIMGWSWAVKQGRYALGGNFILNTKLGNTGMSPGVMREIKFRDQYLVATCDVNNLQAYTKPPKQVYSKVRTIAPFAITKTSPIILPEHRILFKKVWKMRGTNKFYPSQTVPLEIYKDEIPNGLNIASWHVTNKNLCLGGKSNESLSDEVLNKALKEQDPNNEDSQVYRRIFLSIKRKMAIGTFKGKLIGKDADGNTKLIIPLSFTNRVVAPTGIFTYTSQWTRRANKCPASQWPKLIRDISLTGMDYIIHSARQQKLKRESTDDIFMRIKRYGLRWCAGLDSFAKAQLKAQAKYDTRIFAKFIPDKKINQEMLAILNKYKDDKYIIAWYLSDEFAAGNPKGKDQLTVGYQIANYFYDAAAKIVPDATKINLITTWFTSRESWRKYLKTDVFSWDPYYFNWKHLEYDIKRMVEDCNTPKTKAMWITIRSCGPTWYDCPDLWFDIRRQTSVAFVKGCDSINYYMYSHWLSDMEKNAWYTVWPGPKGPIASPRRQILDYAVQDTQLLSSVEYLLQNYKGNDIHILRKKYKKAKDLSVAGKYYQMRLILTRIINKLKMKI